MLPKNKDVFVIHDRATGDMKGAYSRACHDEFEFESVHDARRSNCHGMYKDENKYRIARYRVTYELIDEDAPSD